MYTYKNEIFSCNCFFCINDKPHRETHIKFNRITGILTKAESLDPKDWISVEACITCGHARIRE